MATERIANGHGGKKCAQVLNSDNVNQCLKEVNLGAFYPLMCRAVKIQEELNNGIEKPFTEITKGFLGDHQAMGQPPITFIRQVLAIVTYPALINEARFADDVKERASAILSSCKGRSVGAYSVDNGNVMVRQHVAEFIEKRDGFPSDWNDITLTNGAYVAIESVLKLLMADVDGKKPGVMAPVPHYPLYSTNFAKYNLTQIDYYLDEHNEWSLNMKDMQRSIDEAKKYCNPRAIVVINPGNPTGQVLSESNIQEIIKFAYNEGLLILADEVYQDNVYAKGSKFHSFKKVLTQMGPPYNQMELASFMSCSKGYVSECGFRAGYVEFINLRPEVRKLLVFAFPSMTCPNTMGQVVLDLYVKPPQPGDPSYEQFVAEKTEALRSLAERAKMAADAFNSVEGISCNEVQGSMYVFPQLTFPPNAIVAAENAEMTPDTFFAFALLENTGICILPGACFRQDTGTHHIRTTILPQKEILKSMLERFCAFYEQFVKQYT